jgi:hypothetical protein
MNIYLLSRIYIWHRKGEFKLKDVLVLNGVIVINAFAVWMTDNIKFNPSDSKHTIIYGVSGALMIYSLIILKKLMPSHRLLPGDTSVSNLVNYTQSRLKHNIVLYIVSLSSILLYIVI